MNPNLNDLLDRLGEAAQHLVAARAEQLFHEAYEEAVAEGRVLVKERLLQAMVAQSTAWLAQKAAEEPLSLVPEALAAPNANDHAASASEVSAHHVPETSQETENTPHDTLDGALEWAGEEPMMWAQDDAPATPTEFTFDEPGIDEPADSEPAGGAPETTTAREPEPAPAAPAPSDNTSSDNTSSDEAELLEELARIREQIDRNEHLLGQLQPFLKQVQ